jgi:methyltransferase family protein
MADQSPALRTPAASDSQLAVALDWACSQPGWWHDSANLNPAVLQAITRHAERIGAHETAETGCGLSTVLLSVLAECHHCFTIAAGNSLERVQNVPHIRHDHVNFVIGPSQITVPRHSFARPLDLVLLDGPHGFPFPYLEYFHFYPRVRKGGLLVVDDIHIPTVRQMYDVLRDETMWIHLEDVLTTAFFQRSGAPLFDPYGDGWQRQQFNQRHFADPSSMDSYCPGWRDNLAPPPPTPLLGAGITEPDIPRATDVTDGSESAAIRHEIARLRSELSAMRSSTSWRMTAPLRAVKTAVLGRWGPARRQR